MQMSRVKSSMVQFRPSTAGENDEVVAFFKRANHTSKNHPLHRAGQPMKPLLNSHGHEHGHGHDRVHGPVLSTESLISQRKAGVKNNILSRTEAVNARPGSEGTELTFFLYRNLHQIVQDFTPNYRWVS